VVLSWRTATEIDNAGFRILRGAASGRRNLELLTSELIPAKGADLVGADYTFIDQTVARPGIYRYYLEDVDTAGRVTRHPPVTLQILGWQINPRVRGHATRIGRP
jgi:hypothetical protein